MSDTQTQGATAWRRFRRNPAALAGLGFVVLCTWAAVFGYVLVPDGSRHANLQVLELAKQEPGARGVLLMVPLPGVPAVPWYARWLLGDAQRHQPLPLAGAADLAADAGQVYFTTLSGLRDSLPLSDFGYEAGAAPAVQDFRAAHVREMRYWLGTDLYGRDLLSRIVLGARVSLATGLLSVLISLLLGIVLGGIAGYAGGRTDALIVWLISVMWSIPTLLLALALSFVLGKGFWQLFVAIGVSMWVEPARLVRGQMLAARELLYVEAGRALGFPDARLLFRHMLPNLINPVIITAVANFGTAVLIESGLSFLGIGVEPPAPSWGRMVYEGYTYIVFEHARALAFFPGLALLLLIVSINLVGIGLRDAFDVR
ncbi:MAG: ABC transporter permease [Bacteroidia bacterium]|nr:ABC transporter permease [Bacteroidia bacterium]